MTHYTRLLSLPDSSFFLFGLRGVGKTSWARHHLSHAKWFSFLDEGLYQTLMINPSLFGDELRLLPLGSWVVVDEIQRLPGILNEVH
jgi:uncharacterized protein